MGAIKSLNMATKLTIEGYDGEISIDFTDVRMRNKLIHLMKFYMSAENRMKAVYEDANKIEDKLDKLIYVTDSELEILEEVRAKFEGIFGKECITAMYGDCIPPIDRYTALLDALSPAFKESFEQLKEEEDRLSKKYNLPEEVSPTDNESMVSVAQSMGVMLDA